MIWVCVLFFIQQRTFILTRVNQFYYRIRRNQSQLLELDELQELGVTERDAHDALEL